MRLHLATTKNKVKERKRENKRKYALPLPQQR